MQPGRCAKTMIGSNFMKAIRDYIGRTAGGCFFLMVAVSLFTPRHVAAAPNLTVWDTGSRLVELTDVEKRTDWKAVPSELFALEAEPAKAASDPGYYGREYSFKGDAIVENHNLMAVFWSNKGRVVLYSKPNAPAAGSASPTNGDVARKIVELAPILGTDQPGGISRCDILRNANDEVMMKVSFSAKTRGELSAILTFGKSEIVEIKPANALKGIRLFSPIERGVVPAFIGDDLVFNPADYSTNDSLALPSENLFVGLLEGEENELVMTWPKGNQQLTLRLANNADGRHAFESIDFEHAGQSFYLAALSAPGIWHREELKPTYLEKNIALSWKRPYPAKWKTQLTEASVRTTFAFREAKGTVWRGVPGSYNYPVWFEGDTANFHLSKKVPPKGDSIVYFLEGQNTPMSVSTPVDILKATLGRAMSEPILDVAGQKLRTHHRRGGDGVHRACTCGCTEAIQAFFEKGQEMAKKDAIQDALGDMNFFVECHVERIEEYRRFATETLQFLEQKGTASPDLKPFLERLASIVQQIPQEYTVQKENMKSKEHAADLTRQTMALTASRTTNNLPAYMDLLKAWRGMGGAQDYVVAQCHVITRKLFQEAGYGSVTDPKTLGVAQEVRARCRQILRNPDGYEIWANY
jgi:hypothetical protein